MEAAIGWLVGFHSKRWKRLCGEHREVLFQEMNEIHIISHTEQT